MQISTVNNFQCVTLQFGEIFNTAEIVPWRSLLLFCLEDHFITILAQNSPCYKLRLFL